MRKRRGVTQPGCNVFVYRQGPFQHLLEGRMGVSLNILPEQGIAKPGFSAYPFPERFHIGKSHSPFCHFRPVSEQVHDPDKCREAVYTTGYRVEINEIPCLAYVFGNCKQPEKFHGSRAEELLM